MADLPGAVLERAIAAVQRGALGHRTTAWTLAASDVTDLLRSRPAGVGLVVNPGGAVGFEMGDDGIARLLDEPSGRGPAS